MTFALEPCLFEYFVFLVKERGEYNSTAIGEVTRLWNNIAKQYGLEVSTVDIQSKIQEMSSQVYLDKSVKVIETANTPDNIVWLRQSLAHDALIVTFLINSPEGTATDTPWTLWQDFHDQISSFTQDLNELYFHSILLQTIISRDTTDDGTSTSEYLAKHLQSEFEPYKVKKVKSVELSEGTLWRYGDNQKFLFTLPKDKETEASMFLANDFPYIVSLLGKIENHFLLAVELYENLNEIERTALALDTELIKIKSYEDIGLLEVKRDEIGQIGKNAVEALSTLRICGNNISANLRNLKGALPESYIGQDNFLIRLFEKYEEYVENIKSWSEVGENILMRITKYIDDTKAKLTEHFQQEQIKARSKMVELIEQDQMKAKSKPAESEIKDKDRESAKPVYDGESPYKSPESGDDFDLGTSRYIDQLSKPGSEGAEHTYKKVPEDIEWGTNYICYEDEAVKYFDFFNIFYQNNLTTLCITRQHPDKLRKKYAMEKDDITIYWLSTTSCEFCLPPTLTRISHEISKFIKQQKNRVIILDGLEFLVNHNDFMNVLKFLESTKEHVIINDSILLVTVSPNAFSPKELSLLKKNTVGIDCTCSGFDISNLTK